MNDPKGGVAKVTCPTFEAMGQIPMFHRTYFLLLQILMRDMQDVLKILLSIFPGLL